MPQPLVIACVKWKEHYGAYYVNALYDMVRRNMPQGSAYTFHCFTDDGTGFYPEIVVRALPGNLTGWWNKLYMFKQGMFAGDQRILYFDLDTLILKSLDALLAYQGNLSLLQDFYRAGGYGSGVMLWRAGACYSIWDSFEAAGCPNLSGGDQAWIERAYKGADILQDCFPGFIASYKTDCNPLPPKEAGIVCFHGEPKQDNCAALWVSDVWKTDAKSQEENFAYTFYDSAVLPLVAHARCAVIIGSGPSLAGCIEELHNEKLAGHDLFAINTMVSWLAQHALEYDTHVGNGTQWPVPISNHSTAGLKALHLAYLLGYRNFRLYGFDSCCHGRAHHVDVLPEQERNRVFSITVHGKIFHMAQWMLKQAEEFGQLLDTVLLPAGCAVSIHGDGLLRFLAVQQAHKNTTG